jgi:hypothetical protein
VALLEAHGFSRPYGKFPLNLDSFWGRYSRWAGYEPAPIRKEVRSGCCSQHLMNSTPSHRLWASAS